MSTPRRRGRGALIARTLAAAVPLSLPLSSLGQASGTLKLLSAGAEAFGFIADSVSLWDAFHGNLPNDDNPLWGDANSSPILTFVATEYTFELLVQQPNDVSEFEDDARAQLSGTVMGPIHNKQGQVIGTGNLWEFSVTFEADVNSFSGTTDLDATGKVQHVFAPHPEQGEGLKGASLDFDLNLSKGWTPGSVSKTTSDHGVHADGKHEDTMPFATLSMNCCSSVLGTIDSFRFNVVAAHPIPEPSITLLLLGGLGVVGWVAHRRRKNAIGQVA